MKSTSKLIIFIFTFWALAASAYAQSPREQLSQMVEQLQKTPADSALRERIIELARGMKPAPSPTEATERHLARGRAAFRAAKEAKDYEDAVREFSLASLSSPWLHDAYYNLGVAQDKAGDYPGAMRSLKLAALSTTSAADAKSSRELLYEVEFRNEKAVAAARGPDLTKFQGIWTHADAPFILYYRAQAAGDTLKIWVERTESPRDGSHGYREGEAGTYRLKAENGVFKGVYVHGSQSRACAGRESPADALISPDARGLTVTFKSMFKIGSRNGAADFTSCVADSGKEYSMTLRKQ